MRIRPHTPWAGAQLFCTTRSGGVGHAPYDTFNLGAGAGDDPAVVLANRQILRTCLPADPFWLTQVHGVRVIDADEQPSCPEDCQAPEADAAVTTQPGRVLAILTADCLPVVLSDEQGLVLGAAHAGWRGLAGGVLEATFQQMRVKSPRSHGWRAWIGPAIGLRAFQVGDEVRQAFNQNGACPQALFVKDPGAPDKWRADLAGLARWRLTRMGIGHIEDCALCTVTDPDKRFFSYRREGRTGRMATLAWLERRESAT